MLAKLIKGDINKRDRQESGFTIVEVMIVLAIAGLILAIVFIAVPALQRNSRDAQRKADISGLQSAVATYVGNNNGSVPTTTAQLAQAVESIDFSFYNTTTATITAATTSAACATANGTWSGTTCKGSPLVWAAGAAENTVFTGNWGTVMTAQSGAIKQHDFAIYIEGTVCTTAAAAGTVAKVLWPATTTTAGNTLVVQGPSKKLRNSLWRGI